MSSKVSGTKKPASLIDWFLTTAVSSWELAEAPAGWKAMVDESTSLADLQDVYEVAAKGHWFSPQVRAAFTARRQQLEQVAA